ncbi:hypothetical protein [Streptomyces showdoensis]|uniref:Uncharacterized protein n=1 Tax=Streptomyces showdoensis TaxID=68268 RepID=A0A2P2GVF9_STREW|nr:hypothetical protein [Streptomyces showdoensis]KKZ74869.1 hypothetical protein VO63_05315 [Streptomyces showdoensis]
MTQPKSPAPCISTSCTRDCTTECREAINRAWTGLRGELPPATLLAPQQPVPPSTTEQVTGGRRLVEPDRHTADTITSDALDQLYAELDENVGVIQALRRQREEAEAAIERVRAECNRIEAAVTDNPASPDLAGGYLACLRHIRTALDEQQEQPTGPAPTHIGGRANAEDCPACSGTNPPYPFICPGPTA